MAVRGEFSELEKEILADSEREADTRQGWFRPPSDAPPFMKGNPFITAKGLKEYASGLDPWNPFWNLEDYAVATGWGGLIAHPFYLERLKPMERMLKTRKGLFLTFYLMGHDYEYNQPVRPGDTIRTWALRPTLEDSTERPPEMNPDIEVITYKEWSPTTVPQLIAMPEPYYTFSETFSYGP